MIELDRGFSEEILSHALEHLPKEACGLIAAKEGVPVKVYPMRNADESPTTYRLDPKEQLEVFNQMERLGLELYAIYHSHTHTEAYPSERDRRLAFYPDSRYLILSLKDRGNPVLRGFSIRDGEVTEEQVRIT